MIITCQSCHVRFNLPVEKVPEHVFQVRCSKCSHVFSVEPIGTGADINDDTGDDACRIISVCNQKGGVAKTSTCINLGFSLTGMRKRILLIDFDVQGNLTVLLGQPQSHSFFDVVMERRTNITSFIRKTRFPNLHLLPANNNLVLLNKNYFGKKGFEYLLRQHLKPVRKMYDYIIIDTPPSIEFYTLNALTSSSLAVIPGHCDYLSAHGIDQISRVIDLVKKNSNAHLNSRVLVTMFDPKSKASSMIKSRLGRLYQGRILETVIEYDEKIRESQIMSRPVLFYERKSRSGASYLRLAKEIAELDIAW